METALFRLLIVAEEKQTVEDLLEYFESNGYETEITLNAKTAIGIINEREMDIIMIGLKDMKSVDEALNIIEEINETVPSIPMIVIGGERSKRTENKLIKAGAKEFCPCPIEKDKLLKVVDGFLR